VNRSCIRINTIFQLIACFLATIAALYLTDKVICAVSLSLWTSLAITTCAAVLLHILAKKISDSCFAKECCGCIFLLLFLGIFGYSYMFNESQQLNFDSYKSFYEDLTYSSCKKEIQNNVYVSSYARNTQISSNINTSQNALHQETTDISRVAFQIFSILLSIYIISKILNKIRNISYKKRLCKVLCISQRPPSHQKDSGYRNSPIKSIEGDKNDSAHNVNLMFELLTLSRIQVVGVIGEWGSGKTSFLNLIKEKIKKNDEKKFIWVDFELLQQEQINHNSNNYSKLHFLTLLLKVALKENGIPTSDITRLFNEYAHSSSIALEVNFSIFKNSVFNMTDLLFRTHAQIGKEICNALYDRLGDKKIVLVYDDLDRLTNHQDILEILKLINSINLLESRNIIQLISYDNKRLLHYFSKSGVEGEKTAEKYLDKMINYKLNIPMNYENALEDIFRKNTEKDCGGHLRNKEVDECADSLYRRFIRNAKIKTMRMYKECEHNMITAKSLITIHCDTLINKNTSIENQATYQKAYLCQKILLLTQFLKCCSESVYEAARESFYKKYTDLYKEGCTSIDDTSILALNVDHKEQSKKYHERKEHNDKLLKKTLGETYCNLDDEGYIAVQYLFYFFYKLNKEHIKLDLQYKAIVALHFPQKLFLIFRELSKRIIHNFQEENLVKISDETIQDIIKQGRGDQIFNECNVDDNNIKNSRGVTWESFKKNSIASLNKKIAEDYIKENEGIIKTPLLWKKETDGVFTYIRRRLDATLTEYITQLIQENRYNARTYMLTCQNEEGEEVVKKGAQELGHDSTVIFLNYRKVKKEIWNFNIEKQKFIEQSKKEGRLLYWMLYHSCVCNELKIIDNKNIEKFDNDIADAITHSSHEDKIKILVNFISISYVYIMLSARFYNTSLEVNLLRETFKDVCEKDPSYISLNEYFPKLKMLLSEHAEEIKKQYKEIIKKDELIEEKDIYSDEDILNFILKPEKT
jgi:hypothetical protein